LLEIGGTYRRITNKVLETRMSPRLGFVAKAAGPIGSTGTDTTKRPREYRWR
jgi:hypothetical protein